MTKEDWTKTYSIKKKYAKKKGEKNRHNNWMANYQKYEYYDETERTNKRFNQLNNMYQFEFKINTPIICKNDMPTKLLK